MIGGGDEGFARRHSLCHAGVADLDHAWIRRHPARLRATSWTELSDWTAFAVSCADSPGAIVGGTMSSRRASPTTGVIGDGWFGDGLAVCFESHAASASAASVTTITDRRMLIAMLAMTCSCISLILFAGSGDPVSSSGPHPDIPCRGTRLHGAADLEGASSTSIAANFVWEMRLAPG